MLWPKKTHTRNLIAKKKYLRPGAHKLLLRLENSLPHPHITFLMVRPLLSSTVNRKSGQIRSQFLKAVQAF